MSAHVLKAITLACWCVELEHVFGTKDACFPLFLCDIPRYIFQLNFPIQYASWCRPDWGASFPLPSGNQKLSASPGVSQPMVISVARGGGTLVGTRQQQVNRKWQVSTSRNPCGHLVKDAVSFNRFSTSRASYKLVLNSLHMLSGSFWKTHFQARRDNEKSWHKSTEAQLWVPVCFVIKPVPPSPSVESEKSLRLFGFAFWRK